LPPCYYLVMVELSEAERIARKIIRGVCPKGHDSLCEAFKRLREQFPSKSDSWFFRAIVRSLASVRRIGHNHWVVAGISEFGDTYPLYNVWLSERGKYMCDCYYRQWGYKRKAEICTHIAAVLLVKRQRWLSEF